VVSNNQFTLKAFLQGLYNTTNSNMNKSQDYVNAVMVNKFAGTVADTITVELHDAVTYATLVYKATGVQLNQNGTCNTPGLAYINIPASFTGSYYVTIKSRNQLETTTATPVSFATGTVNYDFTTAATQAFGSNMILLNTGVYGLYTGDLNQDGAVNSTDRDLLLIDLNAAVLGYSLTDLNGDGAVNSTDRDLLLINLNAGAIKKTP